MGIQAAADNFVSALRLARRLLSDTQAALTLANCAAKLRLEMSLTPAGSQERDNQAAALQKLQQLTDATLDDLAAGLTSHFLPGATLSTDEVWYRFVIQLGCVPLNGTSSSRHAAADLDVLGWEGDKALSQQEMASIGRLIGEKL